MSTEFVDEPFEVEIKHGAAILTWPNGERRAVPIAVFRIEQARAAKALAEFDAKNRVVPIKRKRGEH